MRILHTSDWHVGKRLGRYDRIEEIREAIEEVAAIADAESADLVVHSGDLFDRPVPPMEALQVGLAGLVRLTGGGARPVVVVAGNHDSADLFEALAPFLAGWRIHLVGAIKAPADGGVLRLETGAGDALVACLPFLREGRVVDFMAETDRWYGQYAERVRLLTAAYSEYLIAEAGRTAVSVLAAHFMITGARVGGHGAARGERELHMGEAYAVGEGAIPPSLGYVAMGHIHAPQPVPGANVPAEYAGSLLALDFGEAGEKKRVVIVDVEPGAPARVRSVPLTSGRRLIQVSGSWDEIAARPGVDDAYLDLRVDTDGPEPGLDARAREAYPYLVKVAAVYERSARDEVSYGHMPWQDVYAAYYEQERGEPAPAELLAAFRQVEDEVSRASLELTLRGFQSYASEQTFDFRDRRLLGVVGPIGAGKSSLLDGIAFALYGRTPRAGRVTRDLINQRVASAHVELWFEVEGETWRAVRALRRRGQSAHNLYRHEEPDAESERREEVTGERAMTARIEELLGLDFDAFNRSVFLAQNRFAEFLQATAAQRDAVLKGVFGFDRLDRMAEVAKATRDDLRAQLADLERLRVEVEADRAVLEETTSSLADAAARLAELDSSAAASAVLEASREEAMRDVEHAERRSRELGDIAAQLPAGEQSGELLERAATGTELVQAAERALASAVADVDSARRHEAEVVGVTGGPDVISRAAALVERSHDLAKRLATLERQLAEAAARTRAAAEQGESARARTSKLHEEAAAAQAAVTASIEAVRQAEASLHQARHNSMAITLRKELTEGDTCPVCAQEVATLPPPGKVAPLQSAENKTQEARTARERSQQQLTEAMAAEAAAGAEIQALESALETARHLEAGTEEELAEAGRAQAELAAALEDLVPGDDPSAEIETRRRALAEAAALVEAATGREAAARTALEEVRSKQGLVATELVQLATTVATLAAQLGGDLRPGAEVAELGASLAKLRTLWEEAQAGTTREVASARARAQEASAGLEELGSSLGLEPTETIADARQRAAADHGKLVERAGALAAHVARFDELEAASADTVARLETYTTLAEDLLPSRFLKFILDEERRALAALGSEHFERMTRGRYRFTADGEFDVADLTAAESERKSESLSGGETFLASLSLALALAEMVTRTGGRLDAFFLDEGFGSLDPEHLDLAMEGIEALVGGNRLVAVVSHVPQLRERVEDLIELDTDPVTGDTVVVRA